MLADIEKGYGGHRYVAIQRRDAIQPALDALLAVTDDVFAVERRDLERAKDAMRSMWRPCLVTASSAS